MLVDPWEWLIPGTVIRSASGIEADAAVEAGPDDVEKILRRVADFASSDCLIAAGPFGAFGGVYAGLRT
jgi:hypothetical protein